VTIVFDIPDALDAGVHVIALGANLPDIGQTVHILGHTEPDHVGTPMVVLDGQGTASNALRLYNGSDGSTVRGLVVHGFTGEALIAVNSGNHVIAGNWIGLSADGTSAQANGVGLSLWNSHGNTIGGTDAADMNVISGNTWGGIALGGGASGNTVLGNRIGSNAAGTAAVGNGASGVLLANGAHDNQIGTSAPGGANLMVASGSDGVTVSDAGTQDNVIEGNWIGVTPDGQLMGNASQGVWVSGGAGAQVIRSNVIGGNAGAGIELGGGFGTEVMGNTIGTDPTGTQVWANAYGVYLWGGGAGHFIGSGVAGNLISGNRLHGISVVDGSSHWIVGNRIGTDATGSAARANGWDNLTEGSGIWLGGSGNHHAVDNVVSGNTVTGIHIPAGSVANVLTGNRIGTDITGLLALGNGLTGVEVAGSSNLIGTATPGAGNVIAANGGPGGGYGVFLNEGAGGTGNVLQANLIGLGADGETPLGNTGVGIFVSGDDHQIGGAGAGEGNTIGNHGEAGIRIESAANLVVQGNRIGVSASGAEGHGNGWGITLAAGTQGALHRRRDRGRRQRDRRQHRAGHPR
jgi:parallel beta-helix repeat protein